MFMNVNKNLEEIFHCITRKKTVVSKIIEYEKEQLHVTKWRPPGGFFPLGGHW